MKDIIMSLTQNPGRTSRVFHAILYLRAIHSTHRRDAMETRVAVIGIIVEDKEAVATLNEILHEYSEIIIGRMGLPYKEKGISIISLAVDAPQEKIAALTGRIGNITGVSVKTAYSNR